MNIPTKKKGQGAFEYILLLAGILLIVVLVIVILKGGLLTETQTNVQASSALSQTNAQSDCLNWCGEGAWLYYNSSAEPFGASSCSLAVGLNATSNASCFYVSGAANGTCNSSASIAAVGVDIPPQNSEFCSYFRNA